MQIRIVPVVFIGMSVFLFSSCNSQNTQNTIQQAAEETVAPGSFNPRSGIAFDSTSISNFLKEKPLFREFAKSFDTFYKANNYNYVWYDNTGLIETASQLIASIAEMSQEGVSANIPYKDTLDVLLHSYMDTSNMFSPDINTELMLTGEYFYYAKKIYAGMLNGQADSINWYLPRNKLSYATLLSDNLSAGKFDEPRGQVVSRQYDALKQALQKYSNIDKENDEAAIPSIAKSLKPGDSSDAIPALKKRLLQLKYINNTDDSKDYALPLAGTIYQLKEVYGLKNDSLITKELIAELNVPAKKRIQQLMVNMERLRWIPNDSAAALEFILVNIPQYTLIYYENAMPAWRCGVVVGKPMTKTVIFSGRMQYVVFSPYWYVPTSIINKEVKPGMARRKNYLASHNMEWNGGRVRQKPGPRNSLGLVKFLFPNSNNIYLHDTPSKSLFSESNRAFSHGCIRVAQPRELAIRILRQMPEWTPEKIDAAMHRGKEEYVTLKHTIPVYIGYFTAYLGEDNQVNFRRDIYQRDDRLYNMLVQH